MRKTRRRTIALAAAATLMIAGCGSDDDTSSDTVSVGTEAAAVSTEAAAISTEAAADTTEAVTDTTEAMTDTTNAPQSTDAPDTTEGAAGTGFPDCPALEGAKIGYSQPIPDPNFALIDEVMTAQLEAVGAEYLGVNAQFDPGKQVSDIQTLQQQGIDVLIINPVDPTVTDNVLQEVIDGGTPVVVQDTPNDDGRYFTAVNADVESAAVAGAAVLKELVGDGEVAVLIGPPFATVLIRQAEAFAAAAEEVGLNIVETQTSGNPGDPGAAQTIAEAWKQQHPNLAGIWTFNDTSAVGVAATFDDSWAPALVSINGQPEAIPLVEAGRIAATYDLQTNLLARALAYSAAAAICEVKLPSNVYVESVLIDKDNVADWINPADREIESDLELQEIDGRTFIVQV